MMSRAFAPFFSGLLLLFTFSGGAGAACFCWDCVITGQKFYQVMQGAMAPTIEAGECVKAQRITAGEASPSAGDVISFIHAENEGHWVFRVVAMAGETVQMVDGVLWLNGVAVELEQISDYEKPYQPEGPAEYLPRCIETVVIGGVCRAERYVETLPNGRSYEVLNLGIMNTDNTDIFVVPEGHVFVLGDNRDNALDSRFSQSEPFRGPGFVSVDDIIGIFEGL